MNLHKTTITFVIALLASACSNPQPGPDKAAVGGVLGAGWGAGAGAIVGHQLSQAGNGAAIGAGFGLIGGALSGAAYDSLEATQIRQEEALASLKMQNSANRESLRDLQGRLDGAIASDNTGGIYQVFFDPDATSLRAGAVANLEVLAESIKASPRAYIVNVVGHADDAGSPDYNQRLAEARARTVSAYLGERGVSMSQIAVRGFGSKRPLATNNTAEGRQLNRRVDIFLGKAG